MRNSPRLMAAAFVTAALAVGTAACGSSASPGSSATSASPGTSSATAPAATPSGAASAGPLAGLTADQVATKALADTKAAPSVHLTGTGTDSGQSLTLDLTLVHGKGCVGTVSMAKMGSFRLIYDGKTVWALPDAKFYKGAGVTDSGALAILNGKYLKLKSTDSGLGGLATLCSLNGLVGAFGTPIGLNMAAPTSVRGVPAVKLSDAGDTAYLYVTYAAKPELLQLNAPGSSGGVFDFSYPATVITITPPPASQVIDGSKYGF